MSITIDDIAKKCGLSRATVSRVLQNNPNVSEKSQRLVEQVIKETGYRPNQMAQSLAQGYSNTAALIVGNISSVAQIEIAKTIQKDLYERGIMVWLCNSDYSSDLCNAYLDSAVASKLAGAFLITADATTSKLRQVVESGMPVVLVNRQDFGVACDSVLGNDQKAAYQAVEYLIDMGHEKIILLGSSQTMITSRNAALGYQAALEAMNRTFYPDRIYEVDINTYSDVLKVRTPFKAAHLFEQHPDATAVICTCNEIASEFFIQCRNIGKRIPQDMSLVCLDPVQTNLLPEITFCTFGADQRTLGQTAVLQMLSRIQTRALRKTQPPVSNHIVLEPIYIQGNSVRIYATR